MNASRMESVRVARTLLTTTRSDAAIFLITAVVTVSVDLVVAILIGLAVAAFFALRALSRASGVHREEIAGPVHPGDARIAVFRIDGALFFGAVDRIIERVSAQKGLDVVRSEEHTSELQSRGHLVCRLLLEKKKNKITHQ